MWLFQDFLDQSKQLNQTPSRSLPAYHPPNKKYKIIHQALTIPNLPAPVCKFPKAPIHLWKVLTMSRPGKVLRVASN